MKVFLSWASDDSKYIAETLRAWLPQVLQALDPWMSTHIEKGDAWDGAIADGLRESPIGILCLTKDSISSNYLHYEAGAISNVPNAKVCTFLYELKNADVKQPLARFQHTRFDRDEVYKLLETINGKLNESGERGLSDALLRKSLDLNWPELVEKLSGTPKAKTANIERPDRELLEEILDKVRSIKRDSTNIDNDFSSRVGHSGNDIGLLSLATEDEIDSVVIAYLESHRITAPTKALVEKIASETATQLKKAVAHAAVESSVKRNLKKRL